MTSFLGAPVIVKGRSVGNLYLSDKLDGEPFSEDDERLVEMFAVHAGIAIENARLHDQVQRLAVVEERERIGKDLHDGIIQAIYAVGLSLEDVPELVEDETGRVEAVARVDRAIDALNLVIADIRSYILRLRPAMGEEDPVEALARLGEELGMHAVIDLEMDLEGGADAAARAAARPPLGHPVHRARGPVQRGAPRRARRAPRWCSRATRATSSCASRTTAAASIRRAWQGPTPSGRHQGLGNMRDRAVGHGRHVRQSSARMAPARVSSCECRRRPASAPGSVPPPGTGDTRP